MKVADYSYERMGYFSQIHNVVGNVTPIYRRMHMEELKKINGVGGAKKTAFDCYKYVEDMGGVAAAKPLEDFLTAKSVFNRPTNEYNVICRSSVLSLMYLGQKGKTKEFSVTHKGQNIILEEIMKPDEDWNSVRSSINPGCYADTHLTRFPNEGINGVKKFGATNLYIVLKHRYRYDNGTVVNLFVSKEIDAVEFNEEGEEKVSMDLKVGNFFKFANAETLSGSSPKAIIMDFLAGGICYIHGVMLDGKKVEKAVIMNRLSAVCNNTLLLQFKKKIEMFLLNLTTSPDRIYYDKIVSSAPIVLLKSTSRPVPSIYLPETLYGTKYPRRADYTYESDGPHHLVILCSTAGPIPLDNPLYNTDVLTMDTFCKRLFSNIMTEPHCIFVYGKESEFENVDGYKVRTSQGGVKQAMTNQELKLAIFVEV